MKPFRTILITGVAVSVLAMPTSSVAAPASACPPDAVKVGPVCVDTYETSVWSIPAASTKLIAKVQAGTATLADLTSGGATQQSVSPSCAPSFPSTFPGTGNWTAPLYAVSIPGVLPTACVTWFQAEQACALSGKRLLTNQEWQRAAAGTPDPGTDNGTTDCNISAAGNPVNTGSRSNCKSSWAVFDMVGNVEEWVADWVDRAVSCTDWTSQTGIAGGDFSCFGGPGTTGNAGETSAFNSIPGALVRGGNWSNGSFAGVFTVFAFFSPSDSVNVSVGFRCAR